MKRNGRYVFDTNVIVSALLFTSSKPGQAFLRALDHGGVLVSLQLLSELQAVLGRPKFDRYLTQEERDTFLEALIRGGTHS
jgi:predicted nucleic acid-binding protein